MAIFSLASEFPPVSRQDWLARVERVLKQADLDSLRSATDDGIVIEPLYEPAAGNERFERSAPDGRWVVTQRVDHPAPSFANELALGDLRGGATGLALTFGGAASARGFGLAGNDVTSIAGALRNVEMHAVAIRLEPGPHGSRTSAAMRELCAARSINPGTIRLSFGIDPLGTLATLGESHAPPWKQAGPQASQLARELASEFSGPFMEADGRPYHDGGATEAQELAMVLATALAYFRALEDRIPGDRLPGAVGVTLAVDCDLFLGIAKLRAMRLLWRNILDGCSLPALPLALHAESSWRMMTAREARMNLLRAVAATFSAGLGGADSIAVLPPSLVLGFPDGFARRMARNVQLVLLEEAHLHRVGDPAAGAGYVEALTQSLASAAWSIFQDIERRGGMAAGLHSGQVQTMVREAAGQRNERVASRQKPIVGVSEFLDPSYVAPAVLDVARHELPEHGVSAISAQRLSEPFEALQSAGSLGAGSP